MSETPESQKATKIIIGISVVIALASAVILIFFDLPDKPLAGQGTTITEDVPIGGDFILTDQDGNEFNSDQLKGKISMIYFGFTFCPDICPTSLTKMKKVVETLDKYRIDVNPVFITIDPARDKAEVLKEYLAQFHPKFIGLTGSEKDVKLAAQLYSVYYARAEDQGTGKNYMLDHSSMLYIMDKQGKYMKHFFLETKPEEIIEYIRVNAK